MTTFLVTNTGVAILSLQFPVKEFYDSDDANWKSDSSAFSLL